MSQRAVLETFIDQDYIGLMRDVEGYSKVTACVQGLYCTQGVENCWSLPTPCCDEECDHTS